MKSKLFKILGVIAVVAMIASALVAPVAANVSAVTVTVAAHPATDGDISTVGKYTIYFVPSVQLVGTTSGTVTLPYAGDVIKFTSDATVGATDQVAITNITVGGIAATALNTPTAGGAGTYTPSTSAPNTAGVVSYTATSQIVTFTATTANTVISYNKTWGKAVGPTVVTDLNTTMAPAVTATTLVMPAAAETVTFTSTAAGDKVTIGAAVGWTGSLNGTGGSIVGAVITFGATPGQIATLTSTAAVSTSVALTLGTPTFLAGTNAYPTAISTTGGTANGDTITVTFPAGFTVSAVAPTNGVGAGTGWFTAPGVSTPVFGTSSVASTSWTPNTTLLTETFRLAQGDVIGANAQVQINLTSGVTNPSTAGSYTLTVATSKETTAVTSSAFAITNPVPAVVAGVASVYNTAATPVLMTQSNSLDTALKAAILVAGGATVKLTAGTYADVTGTYTTAVPITIQGTDASAANVIIKGSAAWGLTGTGTTSVLVVDSVTIDMTSGNFTMTASKTGTVSNSTLIKGTLVMASTGTGTDTCSKDTFTERTGATGLSATSTATTVSGCTFALPGAATGINGTADVTVSGSTFTGASDTSTLSTGFGITLTGGTTAGSTIGTSTFTGLSNAITVNVIGNVNITGNTITACGFITGPDAITVTAVGVGYTVFILNNKITNSPEYIVYVTANDNQVVVMENQFSGNVKSAFLFASNAAPGTALNVTHNYWGGTAAAPGNPASVTTGTKLIDYTLPLGAAASASNSNTGSTKLDATATAGANITASSGTTAPTILGAAALAANPVGPALPSTVTVVKYFDVFGQGGAGYTGSTVDFYGPTAGSITANSAIYFYNTAFGTWQLATKQTVNVFGNYVEVTIDGTTGTVPTLAQFAGLPFALVTVPTTLGAPTPGAGSISPTNGATGVPVSGVTFTWPVVTPPAGSTITYQFALAQASANTSANEFAILDYSDNSITNAEPNQETLQYNTVYWWEVRAVTMSSTGAITATGPWTISMFTTAPQAVPTTPAVTTVVSSVTTVVTTNVNVTSPVTTITFTQPTPPASTPVIPSYLLWAVIAVGAILVIAVIVLIVRTRRIP